MLLIITYLYHWVLHIILLEHRIQNNPSVSFTTKTNITEKYKMSSSTPTKETPPTFNEILNKAAKSAVRGGTAGAVAMGANVACLMWMRTTVSVKMKDSR